MFKPSLAGISLFLSGMLLALSLMAVGGMSALMWVTTKCRFDGSFSVLEKTYVCSVVKEDPKTKELSNGKEE